MATPLKALRWPNDLGHEVRGTAISKSLQDGGLRQKSGEFAAINLGLPIASGLEQRGCCSLVAHRAASNEYFCLHLHTPWEPLGIQLADDHQIVNEAKMNRCYNPPPNEARAGDPICGSPTDRLLGSSLRLVHFSDQPRRQEQASGFLGVLCCCEDGPTRPRAQFVRSQAPGGISARGGTGSRFLFAPAI